MPAQFLLRKVPIVVSLVRPKTSRAYKVWLWDDAVEHLALLLEERETHLGRPMTEKDALFVSFRSEKGQGNVAVPMTAHRVQHFVRTLADSLGLEPKVKGKIIYRIRSHELGRDFFRTLCENAEVSNTIAEYLLGHKVDPLEYNKFQRTEEGRARIEKALQKVRPIVNVMTGKGMETETRGENYFDQAAPILSTFHGRSIDDIKQAIANEVFKTFPQL